MKWKKFVQILIIVIAVLCAFTLGIYIYHRLQLQKESDLISAPLGQMVEVDGHKMCVYVEGPSEDTESSSEDDTTSSEEDLEQATSDNLSTTGMEPTASSIDTAPTIVFLSGSGTCSPILDFKSLYSQLSGKYRIAVVERFGYGFSDTVKRDRDIDTILEDTRAALQAANITGPYILAPHSMSGLEALYWAQKYPAEVGGIVGLDMSVPPYYEDMQISMPLIRLSAIGARLGFTRIIPGLSDAAAITDGDLTEQEQEIYRALFYAKTATSNMVEESATIQQNAKTVSEGTLPKSVPILAFISDGSNGTGFDTDSWRSIQEDYLSQFGNSQYIELDCGHYVQDYAYETIAESMDTFISDLYGMK